MTFFYNLNKTLDAIRAKPETTHGQLNERANSKRKEEDLEEGFVDTVKSAAQKALNVLGHGDDEAMIRDLQKKAGVPQTGKVPTQQKPAQTNPTTAGQQPMSEDDMEEGNKFTGNLAKARAAGKKQADLDGDGDMEKVREAKKSKPDFLDLDKDGDRKEPMKSAARKIAGKRYGGAAQKDDEPEVKPEVPRGRGRPKKPTDTEQGAELKPDWSAFGIGKVKLPAHKGAVTKHKLSDKEPGKKKAMSRAEIDEAIAALEECGYSVTPLEEKAVSKKQQKFMGMVHAAQKGEKPASKEVAKVAKTMKKSDAEDFAATKHKGLPEKVKKTKEVEETTVAGSVAPSAAAPKSSKGGFTFGKGIYDSLNREVEAMISESMNVSVNMTVDADGNPNKSITVSADGESADHLAQLLNLAGLPAQEQEACETCGQTPCGCDEEIVDENSPDWPTDSEVTGEDDPEMRRWAGGVNGPKSTGQTVGAPFNRQDQRQGVMSENNDLGLSLFQEYTKYKAK
jgi:hypothetical protein